MPFDSPVQKAENIFGDAKQGHSLPEEPPEPTKPFPATLTVL